MNRTGELEVLSSRLIDGEGAAGQREVPIHVIAGTAGVGKTALALHWAHRVRDRFPHGQLYVDLRGYDLGLPAEPGQVLERFLRALGVPVDSVPSDTDSRASLYRSLLADRRVLVILDNAAAVAQVRPLLPGSSDCTVLVTSRSRLSGLVARDGAQRLTVRTLALAEAVELLEHVTGLHRTGDEAQEVAELAALCGQLPLALRIAAERAASHPYMPLGDLIRDLRDESALWDALASDDEEEADAVRSVFAWSYRSLPGDSARLFRLLGLHPGADFDTRAAAVLNGTSVRGVRRPLDSLVGAHLLEQSGPDRYRFHDLLRSYALDQVRREETPESRRAALEHLVAWYLHTAHAAVSVMDSHLPHLDLPEIQDDRIPSFADNAEGVRWYEQEQGNLMAVTRAAASAELDELTWRLPVVLRHVLAFHSPSKEWTATARIGLEAARREGQRSAEADLWESLGMACVQYQQTEEALAHHTRALELRRAEADAFGTAMSLNSLGLAHLRARRLEEALKCLGQSLDGMHELGEERWEGIVLGNLAATVLDLGRSEEAVERANQALVLHRRSGNRMSAFSCLATLGRSWRELGRPEEALHSIEQALETAWELSNPVREAFALLELGRIQVQLDRLEEALTSYHHAATLHRTIADRVREAEAFEGAGGVHQRLGRPEEAAKFHRQAVAGYRAAGDRWRLACGLHRLAAALEASDRVERAREHWSEALAVASEFTDPEARRLSAEITAALARPTEP